MTITNGYATLAEFKTWLAVRGLAGSVGTDASDDTVIEILIEAASRYIDRETGRYFFKDASAVTRYFTPKQSYSVYVGDLVSVTTLAADDGMRTWSNTFLSTEFELWPYNAAQSQPEAEPYQRIDIIPTLSTLSFYRVPKGVKVTGVFGWPSVPKAIQEATLSIVQSVNDARSGQASSGKVTVTAAGVVIRPEEIPPFAQSIIEAYKRRV